MTNLKHLTNLWDEGQSAGMDESELLRYRSNLLGQDLRLTNFGGGNTSAKIAMPDPITGESTQVLWVKGSGGDLGSIKRDGFATLYLDKLLALKKRYRGVAEEDAMPGLYPLCTFNNNPRAASIDTPLHGFLPFRHIDHLHPDWAIALAASANGPAHAKALERQTGVTLGWLPWKRPGFELGLWLENLVEENPDLDGVILASHGLFTWGETSQESYENTLRVIDAIGSYLLPRIDALEGDLFGGQKLENADPSTFQVAELMSVLRGLACGGIGHFRSDPAVMRFVNSRRARELAWQGTSCPDHFVRTRVRPLYLEDASAAGALRAFERYATEYREYYEQNKRADSPALRGAEPTVVLVPGIGMFSFGKNKTEARITGEFYVNAINVMAGATALAGDFPAQPEIETDRIVDNYVSLPQSEAFGIEYWQLEEAKLRRMPPQSEMSRKIALLVGASPGIGRNVAERLLGLGAHLILADLNLELATAQADELGAKFGAETVAAEQVDITDRESVRQMLDRLVLRFGGLDVLVSIAAVFIPPTTDGKLSDSLWKKTYEINVLGSMIVAEEAHALFTRQGVTGNVVLVSSANAVVAKKGSVAYDTSKAAVNHLVRELAVEFAPRTRVNAVAPATVVAGSQMFPRDRVIASLTKYEIAFEETESTEQLRGRLAQFYSKRTLLQKQVSPQTVADAIVLLATDRLGLTTGHVVPVDAGLVDAFLR